MSLIDPLGRRFRSLRVSLTAACNYACDYCVPAGSVLKPSPNALDGADLMRLVGLLDRVLDLKKIRLTGGEPLIAPNLSAVLAGLRAHQSEISLTTNGQFLGRHVDALKAAGCKRINVSLDSMDPVVFKTMAKAGDLESVLSGIEAALAVGMKVKLNTVPMRTQNRDQVVPLFDWCSQRGIELRFIELMRMGHLQDVAAFDREFVPQAELVELLGVFGEAEQLPREANSTSQTWVNARGRFGFISNESAPFCGDCDRLRLTSDGMLYGCISSSNALDIRPALELDEPEAIALIVDRLGRALKDKQPVRFSGEQTIMQILGG